MNVVENLFSGVNRPVLDKKRIWFALALALITDAVQFGLGPFGWLFVDEGLDVIAMILISWAIGFHMLLLPTFLIEFIPGPDMLPTWTACTAAVIMLRKRAQAKPPIEVSSEVTRVDCPPLVSTAAGGPGKPQPQHGLPNST